MADNNGNSGCGWMVAAVIGLSLTVVMCRSCGGKKKEAVQEQKSNAEQVVQQAKRTDALKMEIKSFLKDYAPPLAVKREETISAIENARETRGKFAAKIDKYPTEDTKAIFRKKVAKYDQMIQKLSQLLSTIDHDAMIALAEREARSIEGGGIEGMDCEALIDSAENILKQAALLNSESESPSGTGDAQKPGATPSPSAPSPATAGSGSLPIPAPAPETPYDKLLKQADDLAKRVKAATEAIKEPDTSEPAPAPKSTPKKSPPEQSKTKPIPKPAAPPPIDRASIEKEIRRLDASIATNEASLNAAWDRVKVISHNHTVPVVRGSRQHQEIQLLERVIQNCDTQLPEMKNRRDQLKSQLGKPQ